MVKKFPQNILIVVHQKTSNPARIGQILREEGYHLEVVCPAIGQSLPEHLELYQGIIVFGGHCSANDEHLPYIRSELDWLPQVLEAEKPFLGICLGAQLLARVLGSKVTHHPQGLVEVGYYPVQFNLDLDSGPLGKNCCFVNPPRAVYHWHEEGFQLPTGAQELITGTIFPHQGFCYNRVAYGFQFHPEVTQQTIERWTTEAATMLTRPGARPREEHFQQYALYQQEGANWLQQFLGHWLQKDFQSQKLPIAV